MEVETIDTEGVGKLVMLMVYATAMIQQHQGEVDEDEDEELCEELAELWAESVCFQSLLNRLQWGEVDIKFDIEVPEAKEADESSCGCIWKVCACNKEAA